MKTNLKLVLAMLMFLPFATIAAKDELGQALKTYSGAENLSFDAKRGEEIWTKKGNTVDGKLRTCNTCHNKDHTKPGEHAKTGKPIDPMSRKANKERYTEFKKIKKWLKRNCKWVFGRECTNQEKGDILTYLSNV